MNSNQTHNKLAVVLLPPNLICYFRLFTLLLSLYMLKQTQHPIFWIFVLALSDSLDALDGYLARRLEVSSHLGQILDYTCDRLTLSGGMLLCALFFPNYWFIFLLITLLDIGSHYVHLKATYLNGNDNHKSINASMPKILRYYYGNRITLFISCFMHDFFICNFITYHYFPNALLVKIIFIITFPWFIFKIIVHITQLYQSLQQIIVKDINEKNLLTIRNNDL